MGILAFNDINCNISEKKGKQIKKSDGEGNQLGIWRSGGERGGYGNAKGEVVAAPHGVSHVRKLGLGKWVAGGKNDRTKLSQGRSLPQLSGITE